MDADEGEGDSQNDFGQNDWDGIGTPEGRGLAE